LSVWLDVPFELCWKRIKRGSDVRPLAPDRETAKTRYESRLSDYALAAQRISINESQKASDIAEMILELF
jgi:shikimate kinase